MPDPRLAPSLADFEALADEAYASLPPEVRRACAGVSVVIDDFASDAVLAEMGIGDAYELTGLYDGTPLTERALSAPSPWPDVVRLYRRPILEEWIERGDVELDRLVRHVLVHELAHHLGWTDAEIMAVDDWTA